MAKDKGKAGRRVKTWKQRHEYGTAAEHAAGKQKFEPRKVKLPASRLQAPQDNLEQLPKVEGLVIGLFPGGAIVKSAGLELLCQVAKTFRAPEGSSPLAVGDLVTVAASPAQPADAVADKVRSDGMILARRPRRSALCRPEVTSGKHHDRYDHPAIEKIVVANMDVLLIVASTVQPPLRQNVIDRFLIVAERGELKPVLAVNKIDLQPPEEEMIPRFESLGLAVFPCSAHTGEGVAALIAALAGKKSVMAGTMGVGKSTLINAMVPQAGAVTGEVRYKDNRGRHTTSAAAVYDLPGGGMLVDTPGIREVGITMQAGQLPWYFPEFDSLSPHCKFRDCTHTHEPQCAVRDAAENGQLQLRRYESYLRILESLKDRP